MNDLAGFMPVTHSHYLPTDTAFKAADMVEQPQALYDHCCSSACNGDGCYPGISLTEERVRQIFYNKSENKAIGKMSKCTNRRSKLQNFNT